jgi:glycosyltransferase involved in cell wall biosynthesis
VLNKTDKKAYETHLNNGIKVFLVPNPAYFQCETTSSLEEKTVISVGRLDKVKGFDDLISIFSQVIKRDPQWRLKIFGSDYWGEGENLRNLIKKLKLDKNVLLMGETKEIKKEYLKASIYAMSSHFECFPMVLLEAKECGLPVISFDCDSGPRDLIRDREDGFLVTNRDLNKYGEKLINMVEDIELRKNMGKKSKENVNEFNLEKIIKLWEKYLEEV